jgi:arylsulfatase A-like enzyme
MDLLASLAGLTGGDAGATDSQELTDVLLGKKEDGRRELVLEATSRTALRKGNWSLIPPYKGPAVAKEVNIETGNSNQYQLYDLQADPGQQNNLAQQKPEKLKEMITAFEGIRGKTNKKIEQLELK